MALSSWTSNSGQNYDGFSRSEQHPTSAQGLLNTDVAQTLSNSYIWDNANMMQPRMSASDVEEIFAGIQTDKPIVGDTDLDDLLANGTLVTILSENRKIIEGASEGLSKELESNLQSSHVSGFAATLSDTKTFAIPMEEDCFIPEVKAEPNPLRADCAISNDSIRKFSDLALTAIKTEPQDTISCDATSSCIFENNGNRCISKNPPSYNTATTLKHHQPRGLSAHVPNMQGVDLTQSYHGPPSHQNPQVIPHYSTHIINPVHPFDSYMLTPRSSPAKAATITQRQACSVDSSSSFTSRSSQSSELSLPPTPPDSQPGSPSEGSVVDGPVSSFAIPYPVTELNAQLWGTPSSASPPNPSRYSPNTTQSVAPMEVTHDGEKDVKIPTIYTPVTQRPRKTHPGCTTIKYNRKNNPDLDKRRQHFCGINGK